MARPPALGKEGGEGVHQEGGPLFPAPFPLGRPGDVELLRGLGADGVDDGALPVQLFLQPGGEGQAVVLQQLPVPVGEEACPRGDLGDGAVLRPQKEEDLPAAPP